MLIVTPSKKITWKLQTIFALTFLQLLHLKKKLFYQGKKPIWNMMKFNFSIITQVVRKKQDTIVKHVIRWKYKFGQK